MMLGAASRFIRDYALHTTELDPTGDSAQPRKMEFGLGEILRHFEEHFGKIAARILLGVVGLAVFGVCLGLIWDHLLAPLFLALGWGENHLLRFPQVPLWLTELVLIVLAIGIVIVFWEKRKVRVETIQRADLEELIESKLSNLTIDGGDFGDKEISECADRYIEERNKQISENSLILLIRSGATKLNSEGALTSLCGQLKERTGFNPFDDYETIPIGKRLDAIRYIRDRNVGMHVPGEELDMLLHFNDISAEEVKLARSSGHNVVRHPIEIQYGESNGKLVTVTVTNKGGREERVLSLVLRLFGQDGNVRDEIVDAGDGRTLKVKEFKRAKGLPHVMPAFSSFEAEYYISLGTFIAHNLSGYQASIKMEDHTVIDGEKKIFPKSAP